jgi:sec-independent protein translocase protein TatA
MGSMSLMHWLVVLAIILVLFGAGKLPRVMGDFAKGIKAFKSGMKEGDEEAAAEPPPAQVQPPGAAATTATAATATGRPIGVVERPREHA